MSRLLCRYDYYGMSILCLIHWLRLLIRIKDSVAFMLPVLAVFIAIPLVSHLSLLRPYSYILYLPTRLSMLMDSLTPAVTVVIESDVRACQRVKLWRFSRFVAEAKKV